MRIGFFLQLGYPGEGLAEVRATIDMVRRLRPDDVGVSVSYPLPGTPFFDRVAASMKDSNWQASMDNRPLFEAPFPEPFYVAAKEVIRSTHSTSMAGARLRAFLRSPDRRNARRLAAAGHRVTHASLPPARGLVEHHGLEFLPLEPSRYEEFLATDAGVSTLDNRLEQIAALFVMRRHHLPERLRLPRFRQYQLGGCKRCRGREKRRQHQMPADRRELLLLPPGDAPTRQSAHMASRAYQKEGAGRLYSSRDISDT